MQSRPPTCRFDFARLGRRDLLKAGALAVGGLFGSGISTPVRAAENRLRVRIWCEGTAPRQVYPEGIDGTIAEALKSRPELEVSTGRLRDSEAGLSDADLEAADVLIWWGRLAHEDVPDARCDAVVKRVRAGRLGLLALHGSFGSKPFRRLMGRDCEPSSWREQGQAEEIQIVSPEHPIARGLETFQIARATRFIEPFPVPEPESVVLMSHYEDGGTFRSGMTWTIDAGRVAYLRPGDDAFPVLFHPSVRSLVANAAAWCGRAGEPGRS